MIPHRIITESVTVVMHSASTDQGCYHVGNCLAGCPTSCPHDTLNTYAHITVHAMLVLPVDAWMVNYSTYCPTPKICLRPVLHFFPLDLEMLWHHASFIPLQLGFRDYHLPLAFCQGAIICACAIYVHDSGGSRLTHVISFQLFQGLLYWLQCSGYLHHLLLEAVQIQLSEPVLAQIWQHVI